MRAIVRRLRSGLLLMLLVSAGTFVLVELAPGDALSELRLDPRVSPETVRGLREEFALDEPLPVRYAAWVGAAARGSFGFSISHSTAVGNVIWPRLGNTLVLSVVGLVGAWLLALPIGTLAALRPGSLADRAFAHGTSALLATPDVLVALAVLWTASSTGWLPAGGMQTLGAESLPWSAQIADVAAHLVAPAVALAVLQLPLVGRHVAAAVREALDARAVDAARLSGLPPARVVLGHVMPQALNPLITLLGLSLSAVFSTSLVVEVVLGWPGLGALLLDAVLARDVHLVAATVLLTGVVVVAGSTLIDVALSAADPRIRMEAA